jgi:hypothetical protein
MEADCIVQPMRTGIALLLVAAALAAADRKAVTVRLERADSARMRPRVLFPQARFSLLKRRPPGFQGVPEVSKAGRYAQVALGGRTLRLAFDAPEGAPALGLLYAAGAKDASTGRVRGAGKEGFTVDFEGADCGGVRCNVRVSYRGLEPRGGVAQPAFHMRGRAVLDGVVRDVLLVDADLDGRYDGKADRWIAPRADRSARLKELSRPASQLLDEPQVPFEEDGRALAVEKVAADGTSLHLVLDAPRMTLTSVLDRRYREVRAGHFGQFEEEMANFVLDQKMDVRRGRVETPATWNGTPVSAGRGRARREKKPLLVLFFTETNPWCFRYEFYSFQDAEVDRLLRRFVLVRVDAEKDPERAFQKYAARGLPTLMPLTNAGEKVSFKLRTRDKDGTVTELKRDETMITGWLRPTELAENLKRILRACSER